MAERYVLITVTPDQARYYAPCALACELWRAMGWTPWVVLFGERAAWQAPGPRAAADVMMRLPSRIGSAQLPRVPAWSQNPKFHAATAPRRILAALWTEPDDVVMLGDADMLPLEPQFFARAWRKADGLTVLGADAYSPECRRWPACYQVATSGVWREIMGLGGELGKKGLDQLTWDHMERTRPILPAWAKGIWHCEQGFQAMVAQWSGWPDRVELVKRNPDQRWGGFDRLDVRVPILPVRAIDCHIRGDWPIDTAVCAYVRRQIGDAAADALWAARTALLAGIAAGDE